MLAFLKKINQSRRGFALLLSLIIISLVVSIGLSISLLVSRELSISGTIRESLIAYYASETGGECARFGAITNPSNFSTSTNTSITCNGNTFNFLRGPGSGPVPNVSPIFNFAFVQTGSPSYADITVTKNSSKIRDLDVESEGYNDGGIAVSYLPRQVQRYRKSKTSGFCNATPDVLLVVDDSASLSSKNTELRNYVSNLIRSMSPSSAGLHLGMIKFGGIATLLTHLSSDEAANISAVAQITNASTTNTQHGIRLARYEFTGIQQTSTSNANATATDSVVPPPQPHDRIDNYPPLYPDYIILVTDGAPDAYINANGTYNFSGVTAASLLNTAAEASTTRALGVTIFVVGIGTASQTCTGYSSCSDYFKNQIASDPSYFYEAGSSLLDLNSIFSNVRSCVRPLSDK